MKRAIRTVFLSFAMVVGGGTFLMSTCLMAQPGPPGKPEPALQHAPKLTAAAIQIENPDTPDDLVIPEDFRVSMYENVVSQVTGTKKFQHVYRSGDRAATGVPDLVILHLIPQAFKEGSQKQREVTTISGFTSIKVKVQFTSRDGKVLFEKDLNGRVRFFGENLRVTYDLAKKVANVVNDTF
jgi:hypothetical protein